MAYLEMYIAPPEKFKVRDRKDSYAEDRIGEGTYHDTGCSLAPKCLECPFEDCMAVHVYKSPKLAKRSADICEMLSTGLSIGYTAEHFGISKKLVYRASQILRRS